MDDKTLLNISVTVAFAGLVVLLLLSYYSVIPEKTANQLTSNDIGLNVKSNGTIKSVIYYNSSIIMKIEQKCIMDAVILSAEKNFTIGDNVSVEGTVQEYNNRMELIVNKITIK